MPLRMLLRAERIVMVADPGDRAAVLDAAARLLAAPAAPDADPGLHAEIARCLHEREQLAPTAIGHGVAIPHCRIAALDDSRAAFLRLQAPVAFGAADGEPVDLVLALVVPDHHIQQHLELLAEVAGRFADPAWRVQLRAAQDVGQLRHCLLGDAPGDFHGRSTQ